MSDGPRERARRLFVALVPPPELGEALARLALGALQPARRSLALVAARDVHLTLLFLGAVAERRVRELDLALSAALSGLPAPRFELGAPGTFPERGRPRVFWFGLEEGRPRVVALHAAARDAASSVGHAADGARAAFRPHLTVARVRRGAVVPGPAVRAAFAALQPSGTWEPDEARLVESRLGRSGERYRTIGRFLLARRG